jgi:hypothetical protein
MLKLRGGAVLKSSDHPSAFGARAFERLRDRARLSQKYAERQTVGRPISDDLAAMSPDHVTLTLAEIEAADEILKSVIDRYNRASTSSIRFQSFRDYEAKYRRQTDSVWGDIAETSRVVAMWCEFALTQVLALEEPKPGSMILNYGEMTMRDKFVTGTANAVGPNATVNAEVVQQIVSHPAEALDVHALAEELGRLRAAMKREATAPEQDVAVAEVARAEIAAKEGNTQQALQHLKAAGTWAFDVATKIGVGVATAAIKSAAGW